nr:hypothetical protein [Tanacetum cinerariifolium]
MLHSIWRFDGHPSMMMGFFRNIEGIGPHIRYLRYANSLLVGNMSKYSTPTPSVIVLPSSLGIALFLGMDCDGVDRTVMKLTTGRLVNGSSCNRIDIVIRNLDFEPKDIIAEFCGPSWWKGLSKETSSKIIPFGDGSCRKAFKLISSLIAKGKLK